MVISIIGLYFNGWKSHHCLLGIVPNTDIYVDISTHKKAQELHSIQVFRYTGAINFATSSSMRRALYGSIKFSSHSIWSASKCKIHYNEKRTIIIDMSSVTVLDIDGCKKLKQIQLELNRFNTELILTNLSDANFNSIIKLENLGHIKFLVMPTIHDAVTYADTTNAPINDSFEMLYHDPKLLKSTHSPLVKSHR